MSMVSETLLGDKEGSGGASEKFAKECSRILEDLPYGQFDQSNSSKRIALKQAILQQFPELALIRSIDSEECQSLIALVVPGGGGLGIKTMNDRLIGYSLNNTEIISRQKGAFESAFRSAFAEIVGPNGRWLTISNDFKGILVGTAVESAETLEQVVARAFELIDLGMKPILLRALNAGMALWERRSRSESEAVRREAMQRMGNIELAMRDIGKSDWSYDAQAGIAKIRRRKPDCRFAHLAYAAIAARIHAVQGRALARARRSFAQAGLIAPSTRHCVFSYAQLRELARVAGDIFDGFLADRPNLRLKAPKRVLPVMVWEKGEHQINPELIRLHRKEMLRDAAFSDRQDLAISVRVQCFLDATRVWSTMSNYTLEEIPRVIRRLSRANRLIDRLDAATPLGRLERERIGTLLSQDASGTEISELRRASGSRFLARIDNVERRILLHADLIDCGTAGRTIAARNLRRVASRPDQSDQALFRLAGDACRPSIESRRRLYSVAQAAYLNALNHLGSLSGAGILGVPEALVEEESRLARQGALCVIAGDEITFSLHPQVQPFLADILSEIAQQVHARMAVSELNPDHGDCFGFALHRCELGVAVLKMEEGRRLELPGIAHRAIDCNDSSRAVLQGAPIGGVVYARVDSNDSVHLCHAAARHLRPYPTAERTQQRQAA